MRPSIPAPLARNLNRLQRFLSLAWKLAHPAAVRHLVDRLLGNHRPPGLGDSSLPGTSDAIATALYQVWIRRYDDGPVPTPIATPPLSAPTATTENITVFLPVHAASPESLQQSVDSLRRQSLPHWHLVILLAAEEALQTETLTEIAGSDPRIRLSAIHDSSRGPLIAALPTELITWLEPGDQLAATALADVMSVMTQDREALVVFSDEDRIDPRGRRYAPRFKPDWNPELQQEMDYLGDLVVCRLATESRSGIEEVCTTRSAWRQLLRQTIQRVPANGIRHIPRVLYHRRSSPIAKPSERTDRFRISTPAPSISLIVPTHNQGRLLLRCVESLLQHTDYPEREILVVDHDSDDPETLDILSRLAATHDIEILRYSGPFNYSAINNFAVQQARGKLLGFLNDDLEILHRGWLSEMIGLAVASDVGAVGAKLLYPNLTVQHGGILLGGGSPREPVAGHLFHGLPRDHPGYCGRALAVQELSAVTAACLVMRREIFDRVNGFDEVNLPIAFNDVDLCLRIRQLGLRILWTPRAELIHLESVSRGSDLVADSRPRFTREVEFMRRCWGEVLREDPFYNPNLDPSRCDFSLAFPPRRSRDQPGPRRGGLR